MTLPASRARFEFLVEIYLGAVLGWVDITGDVRGQISISRGLSAESNRANPGTCSFRVDNISGDYSWRNPAGQWWGYIGPNTPLRITGGLKSGTLYGRFYGEIAKFSPSWNLNGNIRHVTIEASGILRRLDQGEEPSYSALRRTIDGTDPLAYWPMEDGSDTGQGGSAVDGVPAMSIVGSAPFADIDSWVAANGYTVTYGTAALVDLSQGGQLSASVPASVTVATAAGWTVSICSDVTVGAALSADLVLAEVDTPGGTYVRWRLVVTTGGHTQVIALDSAGSPTTAVDYASVKTSMIPHNFAVWQDGGNISAGYLWDGSAYFATGSIAGTLTGITAVRVNPTGTTATVTMPTGHLGIWDGHDLTQTVYYDGPIMLALFGWEWTGIGTAAAAVTGEAADVRLVRVWADDGIAMTVPTAETDPIMLGRQDVATLTDLTDQSTDADGGVLHESRTALGLVYRTRASLYNQTPIQIAYTQLAPPFQPVPDADNVRNDVTVKRINGSSARAVQTTGRLSVAPPPAGAGRVRTEIELNVVDDSRLVDEAGWRRHLGTVDRERYPALSMELAIREWQTDPSGMASLLGVDSGDVLEVISLPSFASGDVRTMVTGYSETFDEWSWSITFFGVPAQPWDVAEADGDARVAADGSTSASSVTPGAMSMLLSSTETNGVWTEDAADFPMSIRVGEEWVTASAIAATVTDTFTRSTANGWGTADSGQAWTVVGTASDYSTTGTLGRITTTTVANLYLAHLDTGSVDHVVRGSVTIPVVPTGAAITVWLAGRLTDSSNYYTAVLSIGTSGATSLIIQKRVAGSLSTVVSGISVGTHAAGNTWTVVLSVSGDALTAKAWNNTTAAEPPYWQMSGTDTSLTTGTRVGCLARRETGNTNGTQAIDWDSVSVPNPQTVTISARSVNGIVAAWPAGTEVDVWQPAVVPL